MTRATDMNTAIAPRLKMETIPQNCRREMRSFRKRKKGRVKTRSVSGERGRDGRRDGRREIVTHDIRENV